MGDFFANSHESNALEEVCDRKELSSHRTVCKGLSGRFFTGFEPGYD